MYGAEHGLGFGVLNFTMKSGTNAFHGDLFEFVRNDKFEARGFFTRVKPIVRQNEFGGTAGGPVILPRLYNGKDRTFWHFAYSGFRLRGGVPTSQLITLPSTQERNGDFTDFPYPIFDPSTTRPDGRGGFVRDQVSCNGVLNVICPGRISAVAKRLIPLIPNPDFPGYTNNFVSRAKQPSSDNSWSVKFDHTLNSRQRVSVSHWYSHGPRYVHSAVPGLLDSTKRVAPLTGDAWRLNHIYTPTPNLLNRVAFGYTRAITSEWAFDPNLGNQTLEIPGIPQDAHGFPQFSFDQLYATLGNTNNQGVTPQTMKSWNVVDNVSWVKGRHQLSAGIQVAYRTGEYGDFRNHAGSFSFSRLSTSQPNSPSFSTWGNAFASMMLGNVMSASRLLPSPTHYFTDRVLGLYVDDSIKLTSKFTLSLGLRHDLPKYATEEEGRMGLLNLGLANPKAGGRPGALMFLGSGPGRTGSREFLRPYRVAFSPRLAVAYGVNDKTVIRTGYGISRGPVFLGRLNSAATFWTGFSFTPSIVSTDSGITPAFLLDQGFPAVNVTLPNLDPSLSNGGAATYINQDANKLSFMQTWTFDIQRQLPFNLMVDLAYVGSHTTGLPTGLENLNQVHPKYLSLGQTLLASVGSGVANAAGIFAPYSGFTGSVAQALRPFPQYTTVNNVYQPTGSNVYHALQLRLQKQYSNGLTILGAYTLSKNIGAEGSDLFGDPFGGGGYTGIDTFNQQLERSVLNIDRTQVLVLSWTWDLPIGRGRRFLGSASGPLHHVLGGWQVNAVQRYQSGTPVAVSGGPVLTIMGNRPSVVLGISPRSNVSMGDFDPARDRYLNLNAFSMPAPFTIGNGPRTLPNVRTPFDLNEDFSVLKRFHLRGESPYLEFRAEFFNVLNRVVFGGPAANFNIPATFGIISSQSNTPRVIQFGAKLAF